MVELAATPPDAAAVRAELGEDLAFRVGAVDVPPNGWTGVRIRVDRRPVRCEVLRAGRYWSAWATLPGRTLTMWARDFPVGTVELVRYTDLGPYLGR
ncbi:hypothetical protein SAMN05421810_102597 [Amycolatopsis arida]|uniref:Uncharacterized protein n=1 Tax=Amycolatopsis arida TaxID=587909 RepID=A0A1I5QEA3_9PSEU|nr:hypothetical protein [Amycolatopsis arida]TDX98801.1 hypothetical protein CLV69_101598 [Amycolatopsis arida]SFP44371.1 hypothetical protein SAMN05421810_102597 [Amycolatopsis arida]